MSAVGKRIEAPPRFRGEFLQTGDAAYEQARLIRNKRVQGEPAVVARCLGAADVVSALALARERGLEVSVRGGGHSIGGWSSNDGGLVIDLTLMRGTRIDADAQTAWVGGGTRAADLLVEAERFGLVPVTGAESSIGIVGLTTGIGEAYLTPRLGYSADHLLAFELVTADGEFLQVSADEHPDLFWALRGAGANFGVITALKLQLHPSPVHAVGGKVIFDGADAEAVMRRYWQVMQEGSEYFWPQLVFEIGPSGKLQVGFPPGHTGTADQAREEIDAFCEVAQPLADERRGGSYVDLIFQEPETSNREEWELLLFPFDGDPEAQIQALLEQAQVGGELQLTPGRLILLWRSVAPPAPPSPGAVPRGQGITVMPIASWQDPADDEAEVAWVRGITAALREAGVVEEGPNAMNHVSTAPEDRVRAVYGAGTYDRLARLKAEYDPQNVFHRNFNIRPAGPGGS